MKGLNIYKDGKDPVAKADKDYPEWLWTLLAPKQNADETEKLSIAYLRMLSQAKIKRNALAKKIK